MLDLQNSEYMNFINSIIEDRGRWPDNLKYWEGHHIIPASHGGDGYSKNKHPNIVRLTPGEHFKAHKLLALNFPEIPAFTQAFHIMANTFKKSCAKFNQRSEDISEEDFELARTMYLEALRKNPNIFCSNNKGRRLVCNDITRESRRLWPDEVDIFLEVNPEWRLGGLKYTDEIRAKHKGLLAGAKNPMYGRKYTDDMREKRRQTVEGKKWYTNGTDDIYCRAEDVPEGYYKGTTHYKDVSGINNPMYGKTSATGRKVRCLTTNEIFESKRKASFAIPISIPMIDRSITENKPVKNKVGVLYQFEYVD